jgi:hypothetical protein
MLVVILALAASGHAHAISGVAYRAALVGEWRDPRTGKELLLWPDGHYGDRDIISESEWTLEAPRRIRLTFCFTTRVLKFHFDRHQLVVESEFESGRYNRVARFSGAETKKTAAGR